MTRNDREPAELVLQRFDASRSAGHSRDQSITELKKVVVKALADSSDREVGQLRKLGADESSHQRFVDLNFGVGPRHVNDDSDTCSMSLSRITRQRAWGLASERRG